MLCPDVLACSRMLLHVLLVRHRPRVRRHRRVAADSRRTQDLFACGTITTVFVVRTSSEHSTLACVARNRTAVQDDCSHYLRCRRQSLASLPACYSSLGTKKTNFGANKEPQIVGHESSAAVRSFVAAVNDMSTTRSARLRHDVQARCACIRLLPVLDHRWLETSCGLLQSASRCHTFLCCVVVRIRALHGFLSSGRDDRVVESSAQLLISCVVLLSNTI